MSARGLKAKIAINITLSLFIGMFSINLVTMMTAQRNLIRAEISKGQTIARVLGDHLLIRPVRGGRQRPVRQGQARRNPG